MTSTSGDLLLLPYLTMRYDQFRDELLDALRESKLRSLPIDRATETIDIGTTGRSFETFVADFSAERRTEPFHVSAKISFAWDPFESARSYTREDDLLTELLGRRQRQARTQPRYVRVDLDLRASLPYGSTTPMPDPETIGPWIESVTDALDSFNDFRERKGRIVAVLGGHGDVAIEGGCKLDGAVSLKALSVAAFKMVRVPRVWDDPARQEKERPIGSELHRLATRFKEAFDGWTESIAELARWVKYSPPSPEAKPVEPWFDLGDDEDGEDGGGPETAH